MYYEDFMSKKQIEYIDAFIEAMGGDKVVGQPDFTFHGWDIDRPEDITFRIGDDLATQKAVTIDLAGLEAGRAVTFSVNGHRMKMAISPKMLAVTVKAFDRAAKVGA